MFTVSVERRFWASHQLTLADGSKEPLHSHNWVVAVEVGSEKLDKAGFVMDFCQLKAMVDNIAADFDNTQLDKLAYFRKNNPSAENVSELIYKEIKPKLPKGVTLEWVKVVEAPGCSAKFGK